MIGLGPRAGLALAATSLVGVVATSLGGRWYVGALAGLATWLVAVVIDTFRATDPAGVEVERVVVDTPAAFNKHELMDYVRGADKILVPVLPSEIDIHAATRTIADLLLVAKIARHDDRLAVVANRVKRNTVVFRSLMKFLESLEIPVAAVLRDTQNYIRTASEGRGLPELKKAPDR